MVRRRSRRELVEFVEKMEWPYMLVGVMPDGVVYTYYPSVIERVRGRIVFLVGKYSRKHDQVILMLLTTRRVESIVGEAACSPKKALVSIVSRLVGGPVSSIMELVDEVEANLYATLRALDELVRFSDRPAGGGPYA